MNDLLATITTHYRLTPLQCISKVPRGHLTNNYIVAEEDGTKHFLKEYRFDDPGRIRSIHAVKDFFHEGGIPVIMPRRGVDGSRFIFFDGRVYALFPFVDGQHCTAQTASTVSIRATAQLQARMHLLSKEGFPDCDVDEYAFGWDQSQFEADAAVVGDYFDAETQRTEDATLVYKNYLLKKTIVMRHLQKRGDFTLQSDHLIHRDFRWENIFYDAQCQPFAIFDFEKASRSSRVLDVVRSVEALFFDEGFTPEIFEKVKVYMQAYHAVYPLSQEELGQGFWVWFLHISHSLWFERQFFERDRAQVATFLRKKYRALEYYAKYTDDLVERLQGFID